MKTKYNIDHEISGYRISHSYKLLLDIFMSNDLGHYDPRDQSICLYSILNVPEAIETIKKKIETITTNYKLIILDPKEIYTNINILDIDL